MTALPTFLQPVMHTEASDFGGGHSGSSGKVDDFEMTCQEGAQWCWAAVAQAIERWCGKSVSQRDVASSHIDPSPCKPCEGRYEDPHSLTEVLSERNLLRSQGATQRAPSFEEIQHAIAERRPLPVRIEWRNKTGHFICITGFLADSNGRRWVTVHDPLVPGVRQGSVDDQDIPFDIFVNAYGSQRGLPQDEQGSPNYYYEVQRWLS